MFKKKSNYKVMKTQNISQLWDSFPEFGGTKKKNSSIVKIKDVK